MDNIKETQEGLLLRVRVKANSSSFSLNKSRGDLVLEVRNPPRDNRANQEIIRELERFFGKEVSIVKGLKSRNKLVLIKDLKIKGLMKIPI